MKVKVISIFKDKNTKEVYTLNQELEVSRKRFEEIKDYVDIVNSTKKNKKSNEREN